VTVAVVCQAVILQLLLTFCDSSSCCSEMYPLLLADDVDLDARVLVNFREQASVYLLCNRMF
jgi:hypothetical protein